MIAAEPKVAEPTKVCARCKTRKPWSQFYAKVRWPDGTIRQPFAYCKDCHRQRARAWHAHRYATDPEFTQRRRQAARARYRRLQKDPEWYAIELDRKREWQRKRRQSRRRLAKLPYAGGATLPAEPFAAWLLTLGADSGAIGGACGLPPAQVRRYLDGTYQQVLTDVVDRACLRAGHNINDLYPIEGE